MIFAVAVVLLGLLSLVWCYAGAASVNAQLKEVADLFAQLSPSDPQTHFAAAVLHERSLEAGDLETALREYETAAALAPNNYLLWLSLGSAKGRAGDLGGAESAFRRAYDLAPNYARTNWALGNFLFRQERDGEAFPLLKKAIAADPSYALPAASIALLVADNDTNVVRQQFQNDARIDVALALLLVQQKRIDEAMLIWNGLGPIPDERQFQDSKKQLRQWVLESKRFEFAVGMFGDGNGDGEIPSVGKITNPGFELPVVTDNANPFEWKISRSTYPQIAITDSQKQSGKFSLIVVLNGNEYKEFRGFSQLVAVRSATNYDLRFNYRSDLSSKAQFMCEIASATDGKRLAISPAIQPSPGWTAITVDFSMPEDVDGIELRLIRSDCIASACAATGSIWFDDFSLTAK